MRQARFIPLEFQYKSEKEMLDRSVDFLAEMRTRRSVRHFSDREVPWEIVENCLKVSGTAPSGANLQPWTFVVVRNLDTKRQIRQAAESEEFNFYTHRASPEWLEDLATLGTDWHKPFLESAPYLIAIFAQRYGIDANGRKKKHYYVTESVGIATGMLIAALHHAGLATLTHTPSPMTFLNRILHRPDNEKPFLLLVVGYPSDDAVVPNIEKKPFDAYVIKDQ